MDANIQTYFNDTLLWLKSEYGALDEFMYAISYAQYFGPHSQNSCTGTGAGAKCTGGFNYSTATRPEVMSGFINASNDGVSTTLDLVKLATSLGLKTVSYEGGPGYKVGGEKPGSAGLNNMIESARESMSLSGDLSWMPV